MKMFRYQGGWGIYEKLAPGDNKEAVEALKKAEKDLEGYNYEVISVLGSQVVAGMNYLYLCKGKAAVPDSKPEYLIVKVYENLEGKAEITETESVLAGKEGEWVYNEGSAGLIENSDAENAFNKALENVEGADYEPVAYIGNAGRKYAILSKITTAAPNPQKSISVIYITVTDNGAMIDDIKDILTVNISN